MWFVKDEFTNWLGSIGNRTLENAAHLENENNYKKLFQVNLGDNVYSLPKLNVTQQASTVWSKMAKLICNS